ncbi:MAG: hypothetical protein M3R70_08055 [Actinomycetota bacterium]|nr:hypothetical protein [Actinomycetota bacterium]
MAETYAKVADLPLEVDSYELERLEAGVTRGLDRVTTLVRLHGGGEEGVGEDVTWFTEAHDREQAAGPVLPLAGSWTLDTFSNALGIEQSWRRWAYESAALDLALRQVGQPLWDVLGREPRPVTFVVSPGLGDPSTAEPLRRLLELYPGTRLKLDAAGDWDDELIAALAAIQAVDVVDLKGYYGDPSVDPPPEAELYRRVAEGFPNAWIEDPALTEETEAVLAPYRDRITWDAPIHSVDDVEALSFAPRTLNSKPSRFGTVRGLLDFYDYTAAQGIRLYGGGMFELGPGRGQIQYLASLFHPAAPNDVAPRGFNEPAPAPGLPTSPLEPRPVATGFRWDEL